MKQVIIILAVLSTLFVASLGFPADDCLDCTDAKLIKSLIRASDSDYSNQSTTSENRIFNEQDVKRAFELAIKYLNQCAGNITEQNFYPIYEDRATILIGAGQMRLSNKKKTSSSSRGYMKIISKTALSHLTF